MCRFSQKIRQQQSPPKSEMKGCILIDFQLPASRHSAAKKVEPKMGSVLSVSQVGAPFFGGWCLLVCDFRGAAIIGDFQGDFLVWSWLLKIASPFFSGTNKFSKCGWGVDDRWSCLPNQPIIQSSKKKKVPMKYYPVILRILGFFSSSFSCFKRRSPGGWKIELTFEEPEPGNSAIVPFLGWLVKWPFWMLK